MLAAAQLDELRTRGLTYIHALISAEQAAAIEDRIWAFLARRGIDRADRSTWPPGGLMSKVQGLRQARVFAPFAHAALFAVVDQLLGVGTWTKPREEGQALISFPQPDPWEIPHKTWHFDLPAKGVIDTFQAVRLFGYAATVAPRGGATLLVEGSHELVRRMVERSPNQNAGQSADVGRRLVGIAGRVELRSELRDARVVDAALQLAVRVGRPTFRCFGLAAEEDVELGTVAVRGAGSVEPVVEAHGATPLPGSP